MYIFALSIVIAEQAKQVVLSLKSVSQPSVLVPFPEPKQVVLLSKDVSPRVVECTKTYYLNAIRCA